MTIVNTIIIFCVMSLQLFLYSYAGDRLSSEMANLRVSAYFSPWYKMPSRLSRDVLFVMIRYQKNFNITGGKIYRIDIDNFKNLIKALGSFFSVLRIMFGAWKRLWYTVCNILRAQQTVALFLSPTFMSVSWKRWFFVRTINKKRLSMSNFSSSLYVIRVEG